MFSLGADFIINYKENPDYTKLVLEYTQNKGVDIILDPVGKQNFEYVTINPCYHITSLRT